MFVRDSVFGSRSEYELYKSLKTKWRDRIAIYPNIPFSMIIDGLTDAELGSWKDYFYKTSIDFTFCRLEDQKPLFSVEFDGIGGGFSHDSQYQAGQSTRDPYRQEKMDFKLGLAQRVNYPLIVVSFPESEPLKRGEGITILDSIVGQMMLFKERGIQAEQLTSVLGRGLQVEASISTFVGSKIEHTDMSQDAMRRLYQREQRDPVVQLVAEYDPLFADAQRYKAYCIDKGLTGYGYGFPEPGTQSDERQHPRQNDPNWVVERFWVEWKRTLPSTKGGGSSTERPSRPSSSISSCLTMHLAQTVAVRNFEGIEGVSAEYLAKLVASYHVWKLGRNALQSQSEEL